MTDAAKVNMALYVDLLADEQSVLEGLENDVMGVLLDNAVNARPIWTSRTDARDRFVLLRVAANPQPIVLLELRSSELAALSPSGLRSRLEDNLRQR